MPDVSGRWRCVLLFLNSVMGFGASFCTSLPYGLQRHFVESPRILLQYNQSIGEENACEFCLGLGEFRYNLLTSTLRWISVVLSFPNGYIIDRLGNTRSAVLMTTVAFLGSILLATASSIYFPITTSLYVVMIFGQVLLSFSDAIMIVQDRIIGHWFHDNTTLAISVVLTATFAGSVTTYLVLENLAGSAGFIFSVWTGPILCCVGVVSAILLGCILNSEHFKYDSLEDIASEPFSIRDLGKVPKRLWFFAASLSMSYGVILSIASNLPIYLQLKYGYSMVTSEYITSAYQAPYLIGPFFAYITKKIDCIGLTAVLSIMTLIPVITLMAYCSYIHPLVLTSSLGVVNCMAAIILWEMTVTLSPAASVGTVSGAVYVIRNIQISFIILASGYILGNHAPNDKEGQLRVYEDLFSMLIALAGLASFIGLIINLLDIRQGCVGNQRIKEWLASNDKNNAIVH